MFVENAGYCCRLFLSSRCHGHGSELRNCYNYQRNGYAVLQKAKIPDANKEEATLATLEEQQPGGLIVDFPSLASLLRSCARHRNLTDGQRIHESINRSGLRGNPFLSNILIRMYTECGTIHLAHSVFSNAENRDICTWNTIIGAYLKHGENHLALHHFKQMQQEGFIPDKCSFVSILPVCVKEKCILEGKRIHNLAIILGVDTDVRVGTSLLDMYKNCGDIFYVRKVFSKIEDRDAFSWSVLMSAHAKHDQSKASLPLFHQMLQESVFPDGVIYACTLASCGVQHVLQDGKRVHAGLLSNGCEQDAYVGTALISMYGRCGSMDYARDIFRKLPRSDVITWNSLLAVHVIHGMSKDVLCLYEEMLQEGVKPDEATFVSLLDACSSPSRLTEGKKLHNDLKARGFESSVLVSTTLINMYSRCGSLQDTWGVFNNMKMRDIVSWNVMIDACAQYQQEADGLQLFKGMQDHGVTPNKVTFLNLFQACTDVMNGNGLHDLVVFYGLESDVVMATALVTMYGKCGNLAEAWQLFSMIHEKTVVSWNTMIGTYVQEGEAEMALHLFQQMHAEGELASLVTFLNLLLLHESGLPLEVGRRLHLLLRSNGLDSDVAVGNALISMYGKCGTVDDARAIFEMMPEKDVLSWTAVMAVFSQQSCYADCNLLFKEMQQLGIMPDKLAFVIMVATMSNSNMVIEGKLLHSHAVACDLDWNVDVANELITMYSRLGSMEDVLATFHRMPARNKQTYVNIFCVCVDWFNPLDGRNVHHQMVADSVPLDTPLGNNLISLYGKCGYIEDAQRVFDRMCARDTVLWSAMIMTYGQHGQGKDALRLFEEMLQDNVLPNEVTFLGVLSACNHAGLVDDGCCHLLSMSQRYGITPFEDHYNVVVDLLCRSGRLEEAEDMILKIPHESRGVSWMTLLAACASKADVARGERAARNILVLDPLNPVPYVVLVHMHTIAGREDDATKVLCDMKSNGIPERSEATLTIQR